MQIPLFSKKVEQRTPWIAILIAAGLLSVSGASYVMLNRTAPKTNVAQMTVPVQSKSITMRITASGTVVPIQTVNLSPKTSGRLTELRVEQGDKVKQGDIIGKMDNADIQAQLFQAQAALEKARAQLAEVQAGNRPEEIAQAKARLAQAKAQLSEAKAGSRPQEIDQAKARLEQTKAVLAGAKTGNPQQIAQSQAQIQAIQARVDLASQRLKANQDLARQGAISQDRLQEVISEYRSATASLEEAKRRLEQLQTGTSPAEITQKQAAVREVEQSLNLLQNGTRPEVIAQRQAVVREAQKALDLLLAGSRPEVIAQAQATVKEAEARVQQIQVQLNDTIIVAPFSGIVTQRYATVGAFVTPTTSASSNASASSTSIVAIARGLEILAKIPEVDIGNTKQGQPVEVVADAYPDKVFKGKVRLIAPEAVVDQNVTSFQVRVALETGLDQLRSGMNVDLTFLGNEIKGALMVPTVAIVTEKGQTGVLLPGENDKSVFRPVTIGSTIQDQTQVLEGLKEGEQIYIELPKDRQKMKPE